MEIYFIRHGETSGNLAHRHQVEHSPLTIRGRAQVLARAPEIVALAPTHLIASSHVRAIETAAIIGKACNMIPETSRLFTELHRPQSLYGHFHGSPRSFLFYVAWYLGLVGGQDAVDTRGESYSAFRARIAAAAAHLATYPPDARVVVVSHAVFINLFLAHMCHPRALSPWQAVRTFYSVLTIRNASMITCTYTPPKHRQCGWQLVRK